jgi:predicted kinase
MNWIPTWIPSPDQPIDWPTIGEAFPKEIKAMGKTPQSPKWHSEGDVWTHTKMVCECLVSQKEWKDLPTGDRAVLFLAAFLHDIGKPQCTKMEDDGIISSIGHSASGSKMTRGLLLDSEINLPFREREILISLILLHLIPAKNHKDPRRTVIRASQTTRLDLLFMLTKADMEGRICKDPSSALEAIDNIDFIQEVAKEEGCLSKPWEFSNSHTRYMYFLKDDMLPDYEIFDPTTFEVIMMSGIPGAGKGEWIRKNASGLEIISLDDIRDEENINPAIKKRQGEVGRIAMARAKDLLRTKTPFVIDATNLNRFLRSKWINQNFKYGCRTRIVYTEPEKGVSEAQERNKGRDSGVVPSEVIDRLYGKMDLPDSTECHNVEVALT